MTDDRKDALQPLASLHDALAAVRNPPPRPTTIDGLLGWAKWHPCNAPKRDNGKGQRNHNHSLCEAGQTIIDALDVALPCGVELPTVTDDGRVVLPDVSGEWATEDVRGIAAAWLRAAEAAEAKRGKVGR